MSLSIKNVIERLVVKFKNRKTNQIPFVSSEDYWEKRYQIGGNSGDGSYGKLAQFKAEVINTFVAKNKVRTVAEIGCGDGNQLSLMNYPEYIGLDVSSSAISRCGSLYKDKSNYRFMLLKDRRDERADLVLSLDVIFHLIEDEVFGKHMNLLFDMSEKYVLIYSSNFDGSSEATGDHFRNREFSKWVSANRKDWKLTQNIPNRFPFNENTGNGSLSEFYIYEKT